MANSPIDTQELVRLYVSEELSVRDIATRLGRSYGQIYGLLRKRVVMRPSRGHTHRTADYLKVAETLRDDITAGDWKPGEKIPSQLELAQTFGVAEQTITKAVAHLRQLGYLQPLPGVGTFVRPEQDWNPPQ